MTSKLNGDIDPPDNTWQVDVVDGWSDPLGAIWTEPPIQALAEPALDGVIEREFDFAAGEAIHTENAFKYSPEEIDALARNSGFAKRKRWFDKDRLFSLTLLAPQ